MFSARAYYGLFARMNLRVWPVQLLALAVGVVVAVLMVRGGARRSRVGAGLLTVAWSSVAGIYFLSEYVTIHTYARWFAAAFGVEALLLLLVALRRNRAPDDEPPGVRAIAGGALMAIALFIQPLLAPLGGRPWSQAEVFALAPDPTVAYTLGALLALRASWWAWVIPVGWVLYDAMTLRVLHAPEWAVVPTVAVIAVLAARFLPTFSRPQVS